MTAGRTGSGTTNAGRGTRARPVEPRVVVVAGALSAVGLLVHNLADFPPSILFAPETLVPVALTASLVVGMVFRPGRTVFLLAAGWALLVVVGGGITVLPLPVLPFVPAQTGIHYAAHLAYALAQIPLLWVGYRGARARRSGFDRHP